MHLAQPSLTTLIMQRLAASLSLSGRPGGPPRPGPGGELKRAPGDVEDSESPRPAGRDAAPGDSRSAGPAGGTEGRNSVVAWQRPTVPRPVTASVSGSARHCRSPGLPDRTQAESR